VRSGNQTIEMQGPDLVHYVAMRWPDEIAAVRDRPRPTPTADA